MNNSSANVTNVKPTQTNTTSNNSTPSVDEQNEQELRDLPYQIMPTSPWIGMRTEFAEPIIEQKAAIGLFSDSIYHHFVHDKWLSSEQINKEYPNVSFPQGAPEYVAKFASDEKSNFLMRQNILNNIPNGIFADVGKLGSSLLGNILSPAGLVGTLLAVPTAGLSDAIIPDSANFLTRLAIKSSIGAAESNLVLSPQLLTENYYRKHIQIPMTAKEIGYNLLGNSLLGAGLGAASASFGGIFNTILGFRKNISDQGFKSASDAAMRQTEAGKKVDVDPIIRQGMAEELKNNPIPDDQTIDDAVEKNTPVVKKKISDINTKIDQAKNDINDLSNNIIQDKNDILMPTDDTIDTLRNVDTMKQNAELMDIDIPQLDDIRKKIGSERWLVKKGQELNQKEQSVGLKEPSQNILNDIRNNSLDTDRDLLNTSVERISKAKENLTKKLQSELTENQKNLIINKIKLKDSQLKNIQEHLDLLEKPKEKTNLNFFKNFIKIKTKIDDIKNLVANRKFLEDKIDPDNISALKNMRDNRLKVNKDEVNNNLSKLQDFRSDSAVDENLYNEQQNILEIPKTQIEKDFDELADSIEETKNEMSEDEREEYERDMRTIDTYTKIQKILTDYAKCIAGEK